MKGEKDVDYQNKFVVSIERSNDVIRYLEDRWSERQEFIYYRESSLYCSWINLITFVFTTILILSVISRFDYSEVVNKCISFVLFFSFSSVPYFNSKSRTYYSSLRCKKTCCIGSSTDESTYDVRFTFKIRSEETTRGQVYRQTDDL